MRSSILDLVENSPNTGASFVAEGVPAQRVCAVSKTKDTSLFGFFAGALWPPFVLLKKQYMDIFSIAYEVS